MGLTIHYNVVFEGSKNELIRSLEAFRNFCLDMPFAKVGKVISIEVTQEHIDAFIDMQRRRKAGGSGEYVTNMPEQPFEEVEAIIDYIIKQPCPLNKIEPASIVFFKLWAGEGCEQTTFPFKQKDNKWVCSSFTKTQYATEFVKCHLLVIRALEYLKDNGFTVNVIDEGKYWDTKDLKVLAEQINRYTSLLSSFSDELKEFSQKTGMTYKAEIDKCKNIMKIDELPDAKNP
jgi:hypothetical protein